MAYQTLLVDVAERICTVTINRPDKLNALNALAKSELRALFDSLTMDPGVDVVIITGVGEKAFVAGTDVGELSALNATSGRPFAAAGQSVFSMIEGLGKPVIAAVNGYALGGGCELALACHIRIASENARFGQPEVNLGVIPGYGGTQRLPRLVGEGRAMEMILSGDPIDAHEAFRIGLVNKVVSQTELLATCRALAAKIASKGQSAVRLAIQAVHASWEMHLDEGLEMEAGLFGTACGTDDFREGVQAFLEKRKPNFTGQ
ncbi:MAG: enoyl-CoA hydratase-related protein [Bacteroidetes bacterium]|jgi:enoyl-CoA hydratase|nr:enoyl-CoA hydratase-related protein [Bacteroidota bacterium]